MMAEQITKYANSILESYFKNNRYPRRIDKIRLAKKANVTFQYVVNFFYDARSRLKKHEHKKSGNKKSEKEQEESTMSLDSLDLEFEPVGDINWLYGTQPVVEPSIGAMQVAWYRKRTSESSDEEAFESEENLDNKE